MSTKVLMFVPREEHKSLIGPGGKTIQMISQCTNSNIHCPDSHETQKDIIRVKTHLRDLQYLFTSIKKATNPPKVFIQINKVLPQDCLSEMERTYNVGLSINVGIGHTCYLMIKFSQNISALQSFKELIGKLGQWGTLVLSQCGRVLIMAHSQVLLDQDECLLDQVPLNEISERTNTDVRLEESKSDDEKKHLVLQSFSLIGILQAQKEIRECSKLDVRLTTFNNQYIIPFHSNNSHVKLRREGSKTIRLSCTEQNLDELIIEAYAVLECSKISKREDVFLPLVDKSEGSYQPIVITEELIMACARWTINEMAQVFDRYKEEEPKSLSKDEERLQGYIQRKKLLTEDTEEQVKALPREEQIRKYFEWIKLSYPNDNPKTLPTQDQIDEFIFWNYTLKSKFPDW